MNLELSTCSCMIYVYFSSAFVFKVVVFWHVFYVAVSCVFVLCFLCTDCDGFTLNGKCFIYHCVEVVTL